MSIAAKGPVIVIDLQTGMFDGIAEPPLHDANALMQRVLSVMDWARRDGRKLAFIRHDGPAGDPLAPGATGWPVWPALGQAADEPTFSKTVRNAFSNPALGDWVRQMGATDVVLLGAQTDYCVAGTAQGAIDAGLKVTLVSDAHSMVDQSDEPARAIIERYNAQFAQAGIDLVTAEMLTGSAAAGQRPDA